MHYQKHFARNNMTGPGVYDNNRVSGNQWPAVGSTKLANGVSFIELAPDYGGTSNSEQQIYIEAARKLYSCR